VRGRLRNERFGLCPRYNNSLQLARHVERITRNFGEKRLTGAVFLDVAKAFGIVWIDGPSQTNTPKLSVIHRPCDLLLSPGSDIRRVLLDGHVISSRNADWSGQGWIDLLCPLQSVCQRQALNLRHVELDLYADDMVIIAKYRKPTLLVSYLESYLNDLQRWLSAWRIAINVSKCTAIIFARAGRWFV